jgi:diguanylate cyclase
MAEKSGDASQNNWRDKYLNALDAQEELEQKFARQQDLLRRALVRVSVCAEGQDENIDHALTQMRNLLRTTDEIQPALTNLDEALSDYEQRRAHANRDVGNALANILGTLKELDLSRPIKKEIRDYLSQLPERAAKVRLYPALLQQLAEIQQQALAQRAAPPVALWQKLVGKTNNDVDRSTEKADLWDAAVDQNEIPIASASVNDTSSRHYDAHLSKEQGANNSTYLQEANDVQAIHDDQLRQDIHALLSHWLDHTEVPEAMIPKLDEVRLRIAKYSSNEQVMAALEAVRNLIIEAYLFANKAFASYLNNVNQELADIYGALGGAAHHQARQLESAEQLQSSVLQQMTDLETKSNQAADLDQLKTMVKSKLGNIRDVLHNFRQGSEDQSQLTIQLQELAEKIKAMEDDAKKTRTTLEKHRFKSLHDPLTELPNREAYDERIHAEFSRWQRYQHSLSIAICDLDHFKKINDNFGHQAGDRVLKVISRSIAKRLREVDFFGRYGGEEFVVILPETSLENAHALLEKIRAAIASTAFNYKDEPLAITLSVGITEFKRGDNIESAFARADKALYAAKANGRNRCQVD